MRKDIFIVGAKLFGIWQLLGALSPLAYMIGFWIGYIHPQAYTQEYNVLTFIVHLVTGLILLFRTDRIFRLLDRLEPEEELIENGENDVNKTE